VGVDQEQWLLGLDALADFLDSRKADREVDRIVGGAAAV